MGSSGQDQEEFCLRWNDFESNISSAFRNLRNDPDFCDVRLAVKDKARPLKAHKVVLSSCSPYFRNLLREMNSEVHNNPGPFYIMMRGVTSAQLSGILDFMYYGEANVAQEELDPFLALAEELQVKGLTSKNGSQSSESAATPSKRRAPPPSAAAASSSPAGQSAAAGPSGSAAKRARTSVTPPPPSQNTSRQQIKTEETHHDEDDDAFEDDYGDESYGGGGGEEGFEDDPGEGTSGGGGGPAGAGGAYDDDKDSKPVRVQKDGVEYVVWTCRKCGYKTANRGDANRHYRNRHITQPKVICNICQRFFKNPKSLSSHRNKTHGVSASENAYSVSQGIQQMSPNT